jgi:hypothetical protein
MNQPEQPLWVFRLTSGLMARLIPLSVLLVVASLALYGLLARQALATAPFSVPALVLTTILLIPVHEALHGAGYLAFGGRPKFGAGIRGAMPYFYATCPGRRFTWGQMLVIGALPLVAIDVVAIALAGYSPLVVPAMLAFLLNNTGAVADLWIIAVMLQTPRTALFEDTDEPAMIAWPGPGTQIPPRPPRGLAPRGFESFGKWSLIAAGLFFPLYVAITIIELRLAQASANGTLMLGSIELASVAESNGRVSGRFGILPAVVMAAVLAFLVGGAARVLAQRRRANKTRRPPEDDA